MAAIQIRFEIALQRLRKARRKRRIVSGTQQVGITAVAVIIEISLERSAGFFDRMNHAKIINKRIGCHGFIAGSAKGERIWCPLRRK